MPRRPPRTSRRPSSRPRCDADGPLGLAALLSHELDAGGGHLARAIGGFEASGQVGCLLHVCESVAWWAWHRGDGDEALAVLADCQALRSRLARNRTITNVIFARILADVGELPLPGSDEEVDVGTVVRRCRTLLQT